MAGPWETRRKTLTYRDQVGSPQTAHQAHWKGFRFSAGPWVCSWAGDWGEVQVWASSPQEGARVINHACAIAGIPPVESHAGEFSASEAQGGRNGRPGTFQTYEVWGEAIVTKRMGPSGSPTF